MRILTICLVLLLATNAYAANQKVSALDADATPGTDSLIYTIDDPGGSPVSRKSTIAQILTDANIPDTITHTKTDIISNDASLIFPFVSSDVAILYNRTDVLSSDVGDNITKLLILTSDAVGWTATSLKADIISSDASLIFPYISDDVSDINAELQIITNDAVWWNSIVGGSESISSDAISADILWLGGVKFNRTEQKSITLFEPDQIATVTSDVVMFPVEAPNYPSGILITQIRLATSEATTTSFALEEWTTPVWTTASITSIDVITLTAAAEGTETTISDATVAPGSYVVVAADSNDINFASITVWYKKL